MTILTGRYGLFGAMVAFGVLLGPAVAGPAAAAPVATAAPVIFGSGAPASAQRCDTGTLTCASSDRQVALAWSSAVSTAGCAFRLSVDWGDGTPVQAVRLAGAAAPHTWPVTHTYPGRVSARHPYRIHATAGVVGDARARGCSIESASVNFALLCTPTQLSGPAWSSRWPGGNRDVGALNTGFRRKVEPFVAAMTAAGISVQPQSTLRSPQRSYLMHFGYLVSKGQLAPQDVPAYVPVAGEKGPQVCWLHRHATGRRDVVGSVAAARSLLTALGVDPGLRTAPALHSRHNTGDAIDMRVSWTTPTVKVRNAAGRTVTISSKPKDGTNPDLIAVGATYGVHHLMPAPVDRNHWSVDGH